MGRVVEHANPLQRLLARQRRGPLPRLSGEEAVTQMRKLKPGIPVILSTGYSQEEVMDRFAGVGPVAFIQKPYRTLELAKRMYLTLGLNSENSPQ